MFCITYRSISLNNYDFQKCHSYKFCALMTPEPNLHICLSFLFQDPKLRDTVTMGAKDIPLEDKTLTVVHGNDLCNVSFLNFATNSRETAKVRNKINCSKSPYIYLHYLQHVSPLSLTCISIISNTYLHYLQHVSPLSPTLFYH